MRYLVIEGIDTAGKSTQLDLLKTAFPQALVTKEPGSTAFGQKCRAMALHEEGLDDMARLFLFLADRAQHYTAVLHPFIRANSHDRGAFICSDRSLLSGLAYASSVGERWLIESNLYALRHLLPSYMVILELDRATLSHRLHTKRQSGLDHIEKQGVDYLLGVQSRLKYFSKQLKINTLCVDAALDRDDIYKRIVDFINKDTPC